MNKCVSLVIVGLLILCGITAGALPLSSADIFEKSAQTSCSLPTNTTNLTITLKGGIGVAFAVTNTGEFDAINVTTEINIINGPFHFFGVGSGGLFVGPLIPGATIKERVFDIGLGTVTINATAKAENAAQVTKTAEGIILLFFVILK